MIVVDTDVLIDAMHAREPARGRIAVELATGRLATTCVTVFELLSGARTESTRKKVETLLSSLTILPIDDAAARKAAALRRVLEAAGQGIGAADYLIAGVALTRSHDGLGPPLPASNTAPLADTQSGASRYLLPFNGNRVAVYNGSARKLVTFTSMSIGNSGSQPTGTTTSSSIRPAAA